MANGSIRKLQPLTSLRAFAAGAIIVMHCGGHFGLPADMNRGNRLPLYLGVSFFFVLSGFILTYVYPRFESGRAYARFLWARFARIWPCHVLGFVAMALVAMTLGASSGTAWAGSGLGPALANLAMIHSWIPSARYYAAANPPSWSIATEFGFYLAFPLLLWKLDRKWPLNLTVCLLPPIALMILCTRADVPYESASGATANGLLYMNPISRVFEFALGMTAASFWRRLVPRMNPGAAVGTILEFAAIGLLALNVAMWIDLAVWIQTRTGVGSACMIWFSHGLTCLGFALLIFTFALGSGWISRAISRPSLVFLGEISYAAYLLHWPILSLTHAYLESSASLPRWVAPTAFGASLLAASTLSWLFVEAPCRRYLLGLFPKSAVALGETNGVQPPAPHVATMSRRERAERIGRG